MQQVETKGQLWHIKYPIEGSSEFIVVATTRPETMLGDVAVAVHPHNERLKHLIGKTAILPLVGRRIPIIGDEYADPEKGTGAVKITPAHDFNDFEVGRRHGLPLINIFDAEAKLKLRGNSDFLAHVRGATDTGETEELVSWTVETLDALDRFVARKKIVDRLEERGLLQKVVPNAHVVPHGDRSGAVLEPYLTDQWYVDAKTLAQPAMAVVRERKTVFVPPQWEATFFNWMENIQPWCISRQIWWGHQIPAWYGLKLEGEKEASLDEFEIFVSDSAESAAALAEKQYGRPIKILSSKPSDDHELMELANEAFDGGPFPIWRDEDVLDTWFSSALWPFSTLGWPDQTPELKRFYPTSTLVTGFDIIFFWVARMMMMGLHFTKQVPFGEVYIHALVRDERGQKMSKSKGNVIDPLAVIDEYGADALRFTLAAMAAQGRDIKLSAQRVEGYRNFATKLWNAARFAEINGCATLVEFDPLTAKEPLNIWIVEEANRTAAEVTGAIQTYRFNEAANSIYRFVWHVYCDWYLELAKSILFGSDRSSKEETSAMVGSVRDEILKLLHPFMPFVTEELWQLTANRREVLALTRWPNVVGESARQRKKSIGSELLYRFQKLAFSRGVDLGGNFSAVAEIGFVIGLITELRSARTEFDIPARSVSLVRAINYNRRSKRWIVKYQQEIFRLSNCYVDLFHGRLVISDHPDVPEDVLVAVREQELREHVVLPYREGQLLLHGIDRERQSQKYKAEIERLDADIARVEAKLGNPNFVARAPEEVVEEEKEKREEAQLRKAKIAEALQRLEGAA